MPALPLLVPTNGSVSTTATFINQDGFTELDTGISLAELEGRNPSEQVCSVPSVLLCLLISNGPPLLVGGLERAPHPSESNQRGRRKFAYHAFGCALALPFPTDPRLTLEQSSVRQQVESELDMANNKIGALQRRIDLREYISAFRDVFVFIPFHRIQSFERNSQGRRPTEAVTGEQ